MQKRITDFIAAHSNIGAEKLNELMMRPDEISNDVGSIIDGREAVEYGLIGEIGGLDSALESLKEMIRESKAKKQ